MEKRIFEGLDKPVSLLGFGCMRFPTTTDSEGKTVIDEARAEEMMTTAYNSGVNYFDTAYPYHNGESEPFTGKVLDKFPLDSYYLATKLPVWLIKTADEAEAMLHNQLKRLNKDYIDIYLLHALNEEKFQAMKDGGVIDRLFELKKQGLVRNVGFSFHDSYEVLKKWIDVAPWDVIQLQINYMDTEDGPGLRGLDLCKERNIPVVCMEPVRGGLLANIPEDMMTELNATEEGRSQASWALRFVAKYDIIKVILSGMTEEYQIEDNLKTFVDYKELTDEQMEAVLRVRDEMNKRVYNKCTGCRYCMPCPAGVDIPKMFHLWNEYGKYKNPGHTLWHYNNESKPEEFPDNCVQCGMCEEACPQKISIREDLVKALECFKNLG